MKIAELSIVEDTTYLAVAGCYTEGFRVSNAGGSVPQTSFFFDWSNETWYYTTSTPMIRMDFDPTIGIEENNINIQVGSVFPNPTSEEAVLKLYLANASVLDITVTDLYGKVISSNTMNSQAGQNEYLVNTKELTSGLYCIYINDGVNTITRKFTKQ